MKAILLFSALLIAGIISSQNTISGVLSQESTSEVLPFANLALMQGDKIITGVTADFSGFYEVKDIPNGTYELVGSYVGFQSKTQEITLLNQSHQIDLELQKGIFLKEVVIENEQPELMRDVCTISCCGSRCYFYRIKSDTTSEDDNSKKNIRKKVMNVFPNPSMGSNLSITYDNGNLDSNYPITLRVYSALGSLISAEQVLLNNGRLKLQVNSLTTAAPGYYFAEVIDGDRKLSKKIVIQ